MIPFHSDFLVNLGQVPFWLACGVAVAGIARQTGVGRAGAAFGGMLAMLIPGIVQQVTVARVDVAFCAWFLVSLYFTFRWGETRKTGHLLLFGISLGMLVGTKTIGVLYSLPVLLLFLFQVADRGAKAFSDVLIAAAAALAFGGFWYVRNWAATGNPFFPLQFTIGEWVVFKGAYGREAMQAFHTGDAKELRRIGLSFLNTWLLVYLAVSAALAVLLAQARVRKGRGKLFMLAVPWMVAALFWYVNPHNNLTNGRFLFPAFIALCYSVAVVVDEGKEKWAWLWAALGVAAVVASSYVGNTGELFRTDHIFLLWRDLALCAAGKGSELLRPAAGAVRLLLAGAAFLAVAAVLRKRKIVFTIASAAAVVFLLIGLKTATDYQVKHKYDWYKMFSEGAAWAKLDEMTEGKSLNIAAAGSERMFGLFGTGLRQNVYTVSVTPDPSLDFHKYWKEQGRPYSTIERPQLHREGANSAAWIRNLKAKNTDLLFISALDPIAVRHMYSTSDGFPIEAQWAQYNPEEFKLLYTGDVVRIYAVKK